MGSYVIRNQNKMRLIEAMGKEPTISGKDIAKEINVGSSTVYRWMQEPDDYQTQRMLDAIGRIRERMNR